MPVYHALLNPTGQSGQGWITLQADNVLRANWRVAGPCVVGDSDVYFDQNLANTDGIYRGSRSMSLWDAGANAWRTVTVNNGQLVVQ